MVTKMDAEIDDSLSTVSSISFTSNLNFNNFIKATTFEEVLIHHESICETLGVKPNNINEFYSKLKEEIVSWKATSLWSLFDELLKLPCYKGGMACSNIRVLVVGAGPCGLRTAIECQLLGANVVVVEKRKHFSRNNVLHLWPFVIHDLRKLGIKTFVGKFCARAVEHISIRQLQLVLSKVALLLGVEIRAGVSFLKLIQPDQASSEGWYVKLSNQDTAQETFRVVVGATGKQGDVLGFKKTKFRGKLAIAITVNFINRHTKEEEEVPEISGVSYIFNQEFFKNLKKRTGIDLENILYYKDDTHYFIMTAKRQCLLDKGILLKDHKNVMHLLDTENIMKERLQKFVIDAVGFATNYTMPHFDFAKNTRGEPDVAIFDFTSICAANNACKMIERKGHTILLTAVGDNLYEPFWPTGSGCARGFLSALDAAWMIRNWASGKMTPLQVIAQREAIYKLLPQTTSENLKKDYHRYSIDPKSRYPHINFKDINEGQVSDLYDSDSSSEILQIASDERSISKMINNYRSEKAKDDTNYLSKRKPEETTLFTKSYKLTDEIPILRETSDTLIKKLKQDGNKSFSILKSNAINGLRIRKSLQIFDCSIRNDDIANSNPIPIKVDSYCSCKQKQNVRSNSSQKDAEQVQTNKSNIVSSVKEVKPNKLPQKDIPSNLGLCIKFTMAIGTMMALSYIWHLCCRRQ